ncbi:MAG: sigma 54-interacting transcriptional regulator [Planctomycetes bacterium]|nr:sigma 54-interacting transcriptional regulator [Planctomycetota bacterium]
MKFHRPDLPTGDSSLLDIEQLMADPKWHPLLELMPDGVAIIDRVGVVRYMNSATEAATDVLRSEALDRSLKDFIERSVLEISFILETFSAGARTTRSVADRFGGTPYTAIARCVRDWQGNVIGMVLILSRSSDPAVLDASRNASHEPAIGSAGSTATIRASDEAVILGSAAAKHLESGLRALKIGSRVLLVGESGVGKTEFAKLLHERSGGRGRPFVHVNCGSIPESLFESEMFGYERGSFTGASAKGKRGLVEAADGGTLFLDEIGEIPLSSQAKMLQFIEDAAIQKVGATQPRHLRVQIIAATNRVLADMVNGGTFRKDLFFRLTVVTIRLPPLRDSPEVLDRLVDRFTAEVGRRRGAPLQIDAACREILRKHQLPGNIRELQNVIEHLAAVCPASVRPRDVEEALSQCELRTVDEHANHEMSGGYQIVVEPLARAVRRFEQHVIQAAIAQTGSKRRAAALLGVDAATISRKSRRDNT